MCYFLGLCSKSVNEDAVLIVQEGKKIEVLDITLTQKETRPEMHYYLIAEGGCSCSLFYKRNAINRGERKNSLPNDYSAEIKELIAKFPGDKQTEILLIWAGDVYPFGMQADYEKIRSSLPHLEKQKQEFINLYPFIEDNTVYILL